jgi:demethylmenaquinone methyltransferase/2-methoxy-6-polyprenyl-1,4-benzoquinol methylase
VVAVASPRRRHAQALFAPLGPTYDRYARLLSFGQDPRWRRFMVSRVPAGSSVLDVATGTGAVALELVGRGCTVTGLDQSAEMLAVARRRLPDSVRLVEGDADHLPFTDGEFESLTFTYLFRYVDDPAATLRELARVVRPGGTVAGLDFYVPPNVGARGAWRLYTRIGLPLAGRVISPGWAEVGDFLGPSIEGFWRRMPLPELLRLWGEAGIEDVRARRMSLGGGIVFWGRRS